MWGIIIYIILIIIPHISASPMMNNIDIRFELAGPCIFFVIVAAGVSRRSRKPWRINGA